jgi:AcrR family transcriptional regulator
LIAAAVEMLLEEGEGALDLRKVARRAGVSHAAPYRHFADKHALLVAVAEDGFVRLVGRLTQAVDAVDASADLYGRLLAVARAYLAFGLENPAHLREMFALGARDAYPDLYAAEKRAFDLLCVVLQPEGERTPDTTRNAVLVLSSVHGLTMLALEGTSALHGLLAAPDDALQHLIRVLVDGMG